MKTVRILLLILIIIGLGLLATQDTWVPRLVNFILISEGTAIAPPATENPSGTTKYSSEKYGISFSYPDTYALTEINEPGSALRMHNAIVLINKKDLPLPEGGEGPPAITIDIYQNNLNGLQTENWIKNSSESNYKLSDGLLKEASISGLPALSYRWSGLYEGTTIAVAQPNWIYAFSVTYLEMGTDIIQDFVQIRNSVKID